MTIRRPGPLAFLDSRRWGVVAAGWSIVFALAHLYWAVGGGWGLAESAGPALAEQRPALFTAFGLYGVAVLLGCAAAIGILLSRPDLPRRLRRGARALSCIPAAVFLMRGAVLEVLIINGEIIDLSGVTPDQEHWALVLWNPWFFIGGISFALACVAARPGRAGLDHPHPPSSPSSG